MKRFKGTVKNNVVVLDEGVHLPDGTEVDVSLRSRRTKLEEAVQRLLANPITRAIGMQEIIEEIQRGLEERRPFEERPSQ